MISSRRHRRLTLWLATLALVFAALAPALSHALARATGASEMVEVCTVMGSRWVAVNADSNAGPADPMGAAASSFDHCPYCHLAGQGMAPPPAPPAQMQPPLGREGLPERFFSAACTAHVWRAAQPRAPPLFS